MKISYFDGVNLKKKTNDNSLRAYENRKISPMDYIRRKGKVFNIWNPCFAAG